MPTAPSDTSDLCTVHHEHPQVLAHAQEYRLGEDDIDRLCETFKVFSDSTRMKIIFALFKSEMCVCDIAEVLEMGQSNISHQLRVLRTAGLVKFRKEGKSAYYSLDDEHVRLIIDQAIAHILEERKGNHE